MIKSQNVPFDKLKRRASLSHIGAAPVNLQLHCQEGWKTTKKALSSIAFPATHKTSFLARQQKKVSSKHLNDQTIIFIWYIHINVTKYYNL